MTASQFNLKYDGYLVQLHVKEGEFKDNTYTTMSTKYQAWTNHKREVLIAVKGLASSLRLSDCEVVKATIMKELWG